MKRFFSIATLMLVAVLTFSAYAQTDTNEYEDLYYGYFKKANKKAKAPKVQVPANTKVSYGGNFSLGGHLDLTQEDGLQFGGINFVTEHGFKVDYNNHRLFAGVGVGISGSFGTGDWYDSDDSYFSIPAYLTIKYIYNVNAVSAIYGAKMGYVRYGGDYAEGNAALLGANVGVRIPLKQNVGLDVTAEYQFHCFSFEQGINIIGLNIGIDW